MAIDKGYKSLIPINNLVIYGIIMIKTHIIINCHHFISMTINNSVTYGNQMEIHGHAFPVNIKKEK